MHTFYTAYKPYSVATIIKAILLNEWPTTFFARITMQTLPDAHPKSLLKGQKI
jgi:hypothetical protein